VDVLLACILLTPFRCRFCRERFHRFWRPSLFISTDAPHAPAPVAPLFVMPARHEILNADPEPHQLIQPQPLAPRNQPHLIVPARVVPAKKSATVNSAFIQRLESGMRSPRPLPDSLPGVVLILENDLSIRKLLRRLLERRGYTAVEIVHPRDLKKEIENRMVDLLVVNLSDSGASGPASNNDALDAGTLLALAQAHPALKILALSVEAAALNEISSRLLTLPKPFSLDRFVDSVNRLLNE